MSAPPHSTKRKRSTEPEDDSVIQSASTSSLSAPSKSIDSDPEKDNTTPTDVPTTNLVEESSETADPAAKAAKLSTEDNKTASDDVEDGELSDNNDDNEGPPPLPNEEPPSLDPSTSVPTSSLDLPPLPSEPIPSSAPPDDGWEPIWDPSAQTFYFYNRFTQKSQWDNPRMSTASSTASAPGTTPSSSTATATQATTGAAGRYNPAIHGDYDPTADYAQLPSSDPSPTHDPTTSTSLTNPNASTLYDTTATFNRFTGRFQNTSLLAPSNFSDENKSRRQMNAFFDVDQAANSHGGRSLKAERQGVKLSKRELKEVKERQRAKKEGKRRAWLMD